MNAKRKYKLGAALGDAIAQNDMGAFNRALSQIEDLNDDDITSPGRPIVFAIAHGRMDMLILLLEHGADPNYVRKCGGVHTLTFMYRDEDIRSAAPILLRRGSIVPRGMPPVVAVAVEDYVYRDWTPENHGDWPILLQRQIVAILCSLKQKEDLRLSPRLLSRLFSFAAVSHFVWE